MLHAALACDDCPVEIDDTTISYNVSHSDVRATMLLRWAATAYVK